MKVVRKDKLEKKQKCGIGKIVRLISKDIAKGYDSAKGSYTSEPIDKALNECPDNLRPAVVSAFTAEGWTVNENWTKHQPEGAKVPEQVRNWIFE